MKKRLDEPSWTRLDQTALDIEFLVISVIQGVALAALASASLRPLELLEWQYIPYILTGFLLVLIFWSGAIIHALSFIDWPLDLTHTFLYFLASFLEVLAFSQVTNPLNWYILLLLFQIIAGVLYIYDLSLIRKHKVRFSKTHTRQTLFIHIYTQQRRELKTFVPFSLLYSLIAISALLFFPHPFLEKRYHLVFILGQCILSLTFLVNEIYSFKKRSFLLSNAETEYITH